MVRVQGLGGGKKNFFATQRQGKYSTSINDYGRKFFRLSQPFNDYIESHSLGWR
jgi:hypothetical protein